MFSLPVFQWFTLVKARGLHPFWELLKILSYRSNNQPEALEVDSTPLPTTAQKSDNEKEEDDKTDTEEDNVNASDDDMTSETSETSSSEDEMECIYCNKTFDTEVVFRKHEQYCGK